MNKWFTKEYQDFQDKFNTYWHIVVTYRLISKSESDTSSAGIPHM